MKENTDLQTESLEAIKRTNMRLEAATILRDAVIEAHEQNKDVPSDSLEYIMNLTNEWAEENKKDIEKSQQFIESLNEDFKKLLGKS